MKSLRTKIGRSVSYGDAAAYELVGWILVCETHEVVVHHPEGLDAARVERTWEWCPRCGGPPSKLLPYPVPATNGRTTDRAASTPVSVSIGVPGKPDRPDDPKPVSTPMLNPENPSSSEELPPNWVGPQLLDCGHWDFWLDGDSCRECRENRKPRADGPRPEADPRCPHAYRIIEPSCVNKISVDPLTKVGYSLEETEGGSQ